MPVSLSRYSFVEATLKVERAYRHLDEVKHLFSEIVRTEIYMPTIVRDDKGTYRLLAGDLGIAGNLLPLAVGDCIHNLRCALDYIWSVLSSASGNGNRRAKFPFHETRQNLVDAVSKSPIKEAFPEIENFILNEVKPCGDGDRRLWGLSKLDNIDKHKLIVPTLNVTEIKRAFVTVGGEQFRGSIFSANNATIIASNQPIEYKDKGEVAIDIIFPRGDVLGGESVVPCLLNLCQTVSKITELAVETFATSAPPPPSDGAAIQMDFS